MQSRLTSFFGSLEQNLQTETNSEGKSVFSNPLTDRNVKTGFSKGTNALIKVPWPGKTKHPIFQDRTVGDGQGGAKKLKCLDHAPGYPYRNQLLRLWG